MAAASRKRVRFPAPGEVEVITETVPSPGYGEVRVRTEYSAVSPGTERLVYQGEVPNHMEADASIEVLKGDEFSYPISYGYACVGEVETLGEGVSEEWLGVPVFAFRPHVSRFVAAPDTLVRLPASGDMLDAVMVPSLETAVNLVMDGRPMIGETVLVFGQGVVGLLTTRLLAEYPLGTLVTVEPSPSRRKWSKEMGATETMDPTARQNLSTLLDSLTRDREFPDSQYEGADLVVELTGRPSVLNDVIDCTGFDGRIVVGSWYGQKRAPIDLGGRFHRSRMQIISSQVSTIAPSYRGRWSKSRRMSVVLELLNEVNPGQLVSDRFVVDEAPRVYEQLASDTSMLQPIFVYD